MLTFQNDVIKAFEYVENNQDIVTFGIKPYRIETGYGYIETNSNDQSEIKQVLSFKEKPNTETAEVYVNSGNFYWNRKYIKPYRKFLRFIINF